MAILNFKLSIIIPIFNNSIYLKPLLKSLMRQKIGKEDVEVIAVDDGSTQNMEFLDEYIADDFIVVHKKNGGCASARNVGLKLARGEWVAFLDADDAIKDYYLDVIYNDCSRNVDYVTYHWELKNGVDCFCPYSDIIPNYNVWSYIFRKKITEGVWFDENRNAADDFAWLKDLLHEGLSRYDSKESLVIYNMDNYNSLTKRVEREEITEFKKLK